MNNIAQLERWIGFARERGYQIRFDWFAGSGGGLCEVEGKKILFIDLALTAVEQVDQIRTALENDSRTSNDNAA